LSKSSTTFQFYIKAPLIDREIASEFNIEGCVVDREFDFDPLNVKKLISSSPSDDNVLGFYDGVYSGWAEKGKYTHAIKHELHSRINNNENFEIWIISEEHSDLNILLLENKIISIQDYIKLGYSCLILISFKKYCEPKIIEKIYVDSSKFLEKNKDELFNEDLCLFAENNKRYEYYRK
jgi:hypothetical protein